MSAHRLDRPRRGLPAVVLFDRDGTLIDDVPYNGDPRKVYPVPGAREALGRLRSVGIRTGVVTNQSGICRGLIGSVDAYRVNRKVDDLLGPFDAWRVCPHRPEHGCRCRKPQPGLILGACRALGVQPDAAVMIGDIGADMEAAKRAGVRGILVPTDVTRREEILEAPEVAGDLGSAVVLVLGSGPSGSGVVPAPPDASHALNPRTGNRSAAPDGRTP